MRFRKSKPNTDVAIIEEVGRLFRKIDSFIEVQASVNTGIRAVLGAQDRLVQATRQSLELVVAELRSMIGQYLAETAKTNQAVKEFFEERRRQLASDAAHREGMAATPDDLKF